MLLTPYSLLLVFKQPRTAVDGTQYSHNKTPASQVSCFSLRSHLPLGLSAQSMLLAAIEAKHGPSLANAYVIMLNGPLFGQFTTRFYNSGARGFRLASESGRVLPTLGNKASSRCI